MGRKSLIIASFLLIATLRMTAQNGGPSTFEFIENKGQWDSRVKFQGELPTGNFYLHGNGFTVVQRNADDLLRYFRHQHGNPSGTGNKKTSTTDNNEHVIDIGGGGGASGPGSVTDVIHSHAYRVEFVGGSQNSEIVPDRVLPSFNNYFIGDDPSKWARDVKIFGAVVYKNIYPNIDIRYYSEYGRLKYDLIVNPGGDVNKILMKYEGTDKLLIKNNELIIKTSVGDVKELYPYSYQFDKATGKKEITCKYELVDKNTVRFKIADYSKTATLVIDPTLIFSSYTGSHAGEYGFSATPGPDGSLYAGSIVFGVGFITTTGAYQTNYKGGSANGGIDIGITKFSPLGNVRSYATYIGGSANEYPHSLICDPQGNLVIMGRTYSDDYPTFPAGNLVGKGGSGDIIVTKLNAAGSNLIGSMRIGGTGADGSNIKDMQEGSALGAVATLRFYGDDSRSEVKLDANNNIYVAAQTRSTGAAVADRFPVTGSAFQTAPGGLQDGVVLKINPNCDQVIWSSFLGGAKDDGAFVIAVDPATSDVYVGGSTVSTNFPGVGAGSYQATYQGGQADGYVTRIQNNGSAIIKSSYFGGGSYDAVYGIQFDKNSFPYIMGISEGGNWKATPNAAYQVANSSQFIAKLKPDLSGFVYSTVFGTGATRPNISPVAFLVDKCENVYISGWGGWIQRSASDPFGMAGTIGMKTTSDAIKANSDNMDFYFFVLKKDATDILYGSFFGQTGGEGEHVDGGTSRFDESGVIYQAICANCFGNAAGNITSPFPIKPGVIGPQNGTGTQNCNLAAVKISFNFSGVRSGPKSFFNGLADTLGCVPFTVILRDTVRNAKKYEWSFGDGSPDTSTVGFELTHTFNNVGTYRVRLIAIDSSSCNIRDTAYLNIRVRADQANLAMLATKLPPCQSLTYQFDNNSTFPAGKPFTPTSFIWDFGDGNTLVAGTNSVTHGFAAAGTYIVKLTLVDTNYCNAPESLIDTLRISPLVKAQFETPPSGCVPYDAVFNNTTLAGQQFFWDFGDGTTSTATNPVHQYPNTGTFTIRLVAIDSSTCNIIDSTKKTIVVSDKPTAEFNTTPVPALENTPTIFHNLSLGGIRYKYFFGDGDSVEVATMDTVAHQYNETGTYEACLITYNQYECTDTACHPVQAIVLPLLDVPNAFTPGRFGRNAVVRVEGFGIAKMTWKIYNRWGQVVFETNNRKTGWDGTYKGQPQPMDVYAYVLDVQFSDGTTTRKTGDITLIR